MATNNKHLFNDDRKWFDVTEVPDDWELGVELQLRTIDQSDTIDNAVAVDV